MQSNPYTRASLRRKNHMRYTVDAVDPLTHYVLDAATNKGYLLMANSIHQNFCNTQITLAEASVGNKRFVVFTAEVYTVNLFAADRANVEGFISSVLRLLTDEDIAYPVTVAYVLGGKLYGKTAKTATEPNLH